METIISRLSLFNEPRITFNKNSNAYTLTIKSETEIVKASCCVCNDIIEGRVYFCKASRRFYHKKCLLSEKDHFRKVKQNTEFPAHVDQPVFINVELISKKNRNI